MPTSAHNPATHNSSCNHRLVPLSPHQTHVGVHITLGLIGTKPSDKTFTTHSILAEEEVPTTAGRRLLVVEDDDAIRELLLRLLSREHEVVVASDGREALERFAPGRYDAALIDLGLPKLPGDQVAREIRGTDPLVSLILFTAWTLDADDARLQPFDFHLHKPIGGLDKVRRVVAQAIALHDARTEGGEKNS